MTAEIWRYIKDYEGLYQVSNFGRVKSLRFGKERFLKPVNTYGYFRVCLRKNGEKKMLSVHRLVATTFLPNPYNKPQVNHKIEGEEGKTMNFVFFNEDGSIDEKRTTIEWNTAKENINYGTHNERMSKTKTNGITSKKVLQFTLDGELVREWESTRECGRNGFDYSAVAKCCNGKLPHYKKFIWRYN